MPPVIRESALIALLCLAALHALPVLALIVARLLAQGVGGALKELAALYDAGLIGGADYAGACQACAAARQQERKTFWRDVTAPVAVAYALLFCRRADNRLPAWASGWDNNISLNGDGTAYRDPASGQWVQLRGAPPPPEVTAVRYDDPAYDGPAYYAPGWLKWLGSHPRDFLPRYVWCGWRNRASRLSVELGRTVAARPVCIAGDAGASRKTPGRFLLKAADDAGAPLYHYKSFARVGPLCLIRSVGVKLEYALYWPPERFAAPADERRVPHVAIGRSFKGGG